jgi:prefoldin subunit 5
MSAKEIIESQMTEMRNQIAEVNKQVGRIETCTDILGKILDKFEETDADSVHYTRQQKHAMNELLVAIRSACKRV